MEIYAVFIYFDLEVKVGKDNNMSLIIYYNGSVHTPKLTDVWGLWTRKQRYAYNIALAYARKEGLK